MVGSIVSKSYIVLTLNPPIANQNGAGQDVFHPVLWKMLTDTDAKVLTARVLKTVDRFGEVSVATWRLEVRSHLGTVVGIFDKKNLDLSSVPQQF